MPHGELLLKLQKIGTTWESVDVVQNVPNARQQYSSVFVSVVTTLLSYHTSIVRCPSGSILRPLLFIIYVSDVPLFLRYSSSLLFADDTKC